MKNKKSFLTLCLVFVTVFVAAFLLYDVLYDGYGDTDGGFYVKDDGKAGTETPSDESQAQAQTETENDADTDEAVLVPDFEVYDEDGNAVRLSDFFGKPIVINFWATWCGPCKSEMPGFDNLYKAYGDRVHFLMVNCTDGKRETRETVREYIEREGYSFPVYYDETQIAAYTYGASSIPITFLVTETGEPYGYKIGVFPEEALEEVIITLLEE